MASFKRSLRWRVPDLSRISFAELRRLDMPPHCWVDGLDFDLEGKLVGLCVAWATRVGPDCKLELEALLEPWREAGRSPARVPGASALPLAQRVHDT